MEVKGLKVLRIMPLGSVKEMDSLKLDTLIKLLFDYFDSLRIEIVDNGSKQVMEISRDGKTIAKEWDY